MAPYRSSEPSQKTACCRGFSCQSRARRSIGPAGCTTARGANRVHRSRTRPKYILVNTIYVQTKSLEGVHGHTTPCMLCPPPQHPCAGNVSVASAATARNISAMPKTAAAACARRLARQKPRSGCWMRQRRSGARLVHAVLWLTRQQQSVPARGASRNRTSARHALKSVHHTAIYHECSVGGAGGVPRPRAPCRAGHAPRLPTQGLIECLDCLKIPRNSNAKGPPRRRYPPFNMLNPKMGPASLRKSFRVPTNRFGDLSSSLIKLLSLTAMSRSVVLAAFAALVASSSAFAPPSGPVYGSLSRSHAVAMRPAGAAPIARTARAPMALRMQSEDDKAKAAGVAAALIGLIVSGFSPLIAVLFGGAAVYAGVPRARACKMRICCGSSAMTRSRDPGTYSLRTASS